MCSRHDTTTTTYIHSLQLRSRAQDWAWQHYIIGGERASKALTFLEAPLTSRVDSRKVRLSWALYPAIRHPCSHKQPPTRPHAGCLNPTQWVTQKRDVQTGGDLVGKKKGFPGRRKRNEPGWPGWEGLKSLIYVYEMVWRIHEAAPQRVIPAVTDGGGGDSPTPDTVPSKLSRGFRWHSFSSLSLILGSLAAAFELSVLL